VSAVSANIVGKIEKENPANGKPAGLNIYDTKSGTSPPYMVKVLNSTVTAKQGYIDYLETVDWSYWITGTTRYELTLKSARRLMERWFAAISSSGDTCFWVAEPFELKDGHHTHALYKSQFEIPFTAFADTWQWATGNKASLDVAGKISWTNGKNNNPDYDGLTGQLHPEKKAWHRIDLQRYDPKRKAGGYCTKYVMKSRADYDILYK